MNIDTTRLYAVRPPKHLNNCKVTDLDPLSAGAGVVPRLIAVQMPDGDGATMHAMYHGSPPLALNDYVRCRRDTADTNILVVEGYGGGTGASSVAGGAWPAAGKAMIDTTEYADFSTAVAAASANDEIRVGAGTDTSIASALDLTNIHAVGVIHTSAILSTTFTGDVPLYVENTHLSKLSVSHSVTSASREDTIVTGGGCWLTDLEISGANAGAGAVRSITTNGAGDRIVDCFVETDDEALYIDTGSTTKVFGGRFKSSGNYGCVINAGTVEFFGPVLEGSSGSLNVAGGTASGWYFDDSGDLYVIVGNVSYKVIAHDIAVHVTDAGAQTLSDSTWTKINFDTERHDTDTMHDTVTNNTRLTCKTAGKFIVGAQLEFDSNATGRRGIRINKNGSTTVDEAIIIQDAYTGGIHSVECQTEVDLAVNDYLELSAVQTSGGNLDTVKDSNGSPEFWMIRI